MRAVVCLKQVIDPLTPATSLVLDAQGKKIRAGVAAPPVINGFDEQGIEAALRLRETIKISRSSAWRSANASTMTS